MNKLKGQNDLSLKENFQNIKLIYNESNVSGFYKGNVERIRKAEKCKIE